MHLPSVPPNIALITGPMLLGYLFSYGLLGFLVFQIYVYNVSFPSDRPWMKGLVWLVFVLECVSSIFATIAAWDQLGAGWGDVDTLLTEWAGYPQPPLCGLIAMIIQLFFVWRIWVLKRWVLIPAIITTISITQWVMVFYIGVKVSLTNLLELNNLTAFAIIWLAGSAMSDVMIAVSMVYILLQKRRRSAIRTTNSILSRLITSTIETGMATAVGAIIDLVLFLRFRQTNIHFLMFLMLSKLYSNTLMTTLNARSPGFGMAHTNSQSAVLWNDQNETVMRNGNQNREPRFVQGGTRTSTTGVEMIVLPKEPDTHDPCSGK